jgi:hypothetical protein
VVVEELDGTLATEGASFRKCTLFFSVLSPNLGSPHCRY